MSEVGPGFLYTLLDETVGPYQVPGLAYVVDVPDAATVAQLDQAADPVDVLLVLMPDDVDDLLEDVLDRPFSAVATIVEGMLTHFGLESPPEAGYAVLARELDRYGPGIEADLEDRGVNLYDYVLDTARWPWSKLMRRLAFLPPGGGYNSMRAADLELAQQLVDARENGDLPELDNRPPVLGWSPELEALTKASDTLGRIEHAIYASSQKHKKISSPPPKPSKRPKFAQERASNLRLMREHDEMAGKLLGDRYAPKGW